MGAWEKFKAKISPNAVERLRNIDKFDRFKKGVSAARNITKTLRKIGDKPSVKGYLSLTAEVVDQFLRLGYKFDLASEGFCIVYFQSFTNYILSLIREHPGSQKISMGFTTLYLLELQGETFIASEGSRESGCRIYMLTDNTENYEYLDTAYKIIGRLIWEKYGNYIRVTAQDGNASLERWNPGEILDSEQTEWLHSRVEPFIRSKIKRSVLLYGDPGVGKSCMARALSAKLGKYTLFIDTPILKNQMSGDARITLLEMLHPDVFILDDLDRVEDSSFLLSCVSDIHDVVPLFIATVNDKDSFDPAVVRAGRFDEFVEVSRVMPPSHIIPDLHPEVAKEIDEWPVAFIQELKKRIIAYKLDRTSAESLEPELDELRSRVAHNEVHLIPQTMKSPNPGKKKVHWFRKNQTKSVRQLLDG